jgi:nucleosome binding factor SPN SPT16 subunit
MEWCYPPIIQSGGKYDLKPSAMSDTNFLHDAVVVCSLGVRYHNYCSNLSRTFLVNPEKVDIAIFKMKSDVDVYVFDIGKRKKLRIPY